MLLPLLALGILIFARWRVVFVRGGDLEAFNFASQILIQTQLDGNSVRRLFIPSLAAAIVAPSQLLNEMYLTESGRDPILWLLLIIYRSIGPLVVQAVLPLHAITASQLHYILDIFEILVVFASCGHPAPLPHFVLIG